MRDVKGYLFSKPMRAFGGRGLDRRVFYGKDPSQNLDSRSPFFPFKVHLCPLPEDLPDKELQDLFRKFKRGFLSGFGENVRAHEISMNMGENSEELDYFEDKSNLVVLTKNIYGIHANSSEVYGKNKKGEQRVLGSREFQTFRDYSSAMEVYNQIRKMNPDNSINLSTFVLEDVTSHLS